MAKIDIGICVYDISGEQDGTAKDALEKGVQVLDRSHLGCESYYMELADLKDSIEKEFDVKIKNV
ncbi:MAG: hypothetical protein IIU74_02480 [Ruminiclostridium sp.]|nr:hypothetical protein [Ruminiclostridium sp.]